MATIGTDMGLVWLDEGFEWRARGRREVRTQRCVEDLRLSAFGVP